MKVLFLFLVYWIILLIVFIINFLVGCLICSVLKMVVLLFVIKIWLVDVYINVCRFWGLNLRNIKDFSVRVIWRDFEKFNNFNFVFEKEIIWYM